MASLGGTLLCTEETAWTSDDKRLKLQRWNTLANSLTSYEARSLAPREKNFPRLPLKCVFQLCKILEEHISQALQCGFQRFKKNGGKWKLNFQA